MCSEDALAELDPNRIRLTARWSNKSDGSEPYMRSDLVGITPIEIWKRDEKYHHCWLGDHLSFIARNVVQTAGTCADHPIHLVIKEQYPTEYKKIKDELPTYYPGEGSIKRSNMEDKAVHKGVYLKMQNVARVHAEHELLRRTAIATATRKASLTRRYKRFRERREQFLWAERAMMRVKEKEAARRKLADRKARKNDTTETASQMVSMSRDMRPMMYYNHQSVPVHPDAIDLIPESMCFEVRLYEKSVSLVKMNIPDESGHQNKRAMANKKMFQEAMLRHISKRARRMHNHNNMTRRKKIKDYRKFEKTRTHVKLLGYILNEYMVKGDRACPMTDDVTDPEDSNDGYYYRTLHGIEVKPAEYEERIPLVERQTVYHRGMRIKVSNPVRSQQ